MVISLSNLTIAIYFLQSVPFEWPNKDPIYSLCVFPQFEAKAFVGIPFGGWYSGNSYLLF